MLRQGHQMQLVPYRIHARVTISTTLHGRNTSGRTGAGISTPSLRRGCRQLRRNGVKDWRCILWPSALGNLGLHCLGEPAIHWRHLLPRHANVNVVVVILRRHIRRSRFGLHNHRFLSGLKPTSSRGDRRRGHPGFLLRVC